MVKSLKHIFNKRPDEFDETPQGICPNCWGNHEYGNVIRAKYRDLQIDVNNNTSKHAFIQGFIVTNLKGIQLKSSVNGLECSTCSDK